MPVSIQNGQNSGAVRHGVQMHVQRNLHIFTAHDFPNFPHLRGVRQPEDLVAHTCLTGRDANRRLRARRNVVSGIGKLGLLPPARLQSVAVVERLGQTNLRKRSPHRHNFADRNAPVVRFFPAHQRGVALFHHVAFREAAAIEHLPQAFDDRLARMIADMCFRRIERLAIGSRDDADVFRPFHAAFQLKGIYARVAQLGNAVDQHQILCGEQVAARSVFQRVGQSAGLRASAAIAAPSADHAGKQALTRYRHAKRAVRKGLYLNADVRHPSQLIQRTFPCRNDARKAHLLHQPSALRVVDRHLCAGMQHQMGIALLNDPHHAHILHQHGVHAHIGEQVEHIAKVIQFALLDQRIDRHIDFLPSFVRIGHSVSKPIRIEIPRVAARAEGRIAQIDSVRAASDCRNECFAVSRR